jgi:uncharacterized membrane protein YdbT with pleckstrin-like domain
MRYVDRVLQPGETVRLVTTVSWVSYLPGIGLWIVAGIIAAMHPDPHAVPVLNIMVLTVAALIFLAGLALNLRAWFRRLTTEVAVTDRRIIYKRGLINRHTVEMHMDKVESVDVDQSILGRIFNYGDIIIRGTGETVEPLRGIDRPLDFRNHVTAA